MHQLKWLLLLLFLFMFGCGGGSTGSEKQTENQSSERLRIACVGDSITEGYKLPNPATQSYPAQLAKLVDKDVDVRNFGLSGRTVLKAGNAPYWNSTQYKQSLAYNPEIVVIMLGTNDMKDENFAHKNDIVKDYNALVESYKALSAKPIIYICLPTPSYGNFRGISNKRIVEVLIPSAKEVASKHSLGVIDLHTALSAKRALFPDTLHPNAQAAKLMAEHVYATIY